MTYNSFVTFRHNEKKKERKNRKRGKQIQFKYAKASFFLLREKL
jgi:hypothetical protein